MTKFAARRSTEMICCIPRAFGSDALTYPATTLRLKTVGTEQFFPDVSIIPDLTEKRGKYAWPGGVARM